MWLGRCILAPPTSLVPRRSTPPLLGVARPHPVIVPSSTASTSSSLKGKKTCCEQNPCFNDHDLDHKDHDVDHDADQDNHDFDHDVEHDDHVVDDDDHDVDHDVVYDNCDDSHDQYEDYNHFVNEQSNDNSTTRTIGMTLGRRQ